ncbi:MAG: hypothetical protein ABI365_08420 [Lysobacteraceae bacterium]
MNSDTKIHSASATPSNKPRWLAWACLAALLAIIAISYWPGRNGGYTFDDYPNIVDNAPLHVTQLKWNDWIAAAMSSPAKDLPRPLAMLSFAINHYFTGLNPQPMKLTNIAIQMLNTLLVFLLVRSLLRAVAPADSAPGNRHAWIALFTAACWGLHPINLMAVLYIVQRMESLCHLFVFAGLWMYVVGRMRQRNGKRGWGLVLGGVIGGTGLGLLAKESAALLPLYALCVEACIFRFRDARGRRDPRMFGLYFIVLVLPAIAGLAWLLPQVLAPSAFHARDFTLGDRLLTEPRIVLDYLRWIVFPDLNQLSLNHDDFVISRSLWNPATTLPAIIGILALPVIAWWCRRKRPLLAIGLLWFVGAQLLTATIIPLELVFEHRNYFASLGICLALADLLLFTPVPPITRRAGAGIAILFLLYFASVTNLRAREWSNPFRFSSSEAAKHPQSPRATYDLARTLVVMTQYQANSPFIHESLRALDIARQSPNNGILPDHASLIFAARIGSTMPDAWWTDMQGKLRQLPIGAQELSALAALTDCAVVKKCVFPQAQMLATFDAAASQGPNPEVMNMRGNYVLNVLGDSAQALSLWQQAVALRPNERQYHITLAKLLIVLHRYDEARAQIAQLRNFGRLGQNEADAEALAARLRSAAAHAAAPSPDLSVMQPSQPRTP